MKEEDTPTTSTVSSLKRHLFRSIRCGDVDGVERVLMEQPSLVEATYTLERRGLWCQLTGSSSISITPLMACVVLVKRSVTPHTGVLLEIEGPEVAGGGTENRVEAREERRGGETKCLRKESKAENEGNERSNERVKCQNEAKITDAKNKNMKSGDGGSKETGRWRWWKRKQKSKKDEFLIVAESGTVASGGRCQPVTTNASTSTSGLLSRQEEEEEEAVSLSLARCLISHGALICATAGRASLSALHLATFYQWPALTQLLLAQASNTGQDSGVNIADRYGNTPLHYAICRSNVRLTRLLCRHGARPHLANSVGISPIDVAYLNGQESSMQLDYSLDPVFYPVRIPILHTAAMQVAKAAHHRGTILTIQTPLLDSQMSCEEKNSKKSTAKPGSKNVRHRPNRKIAVNIHFVQKDKNGEISEAKNDAKFMAWQKREEKKKKEIVWQDKRDWKKPVDLTLNPDVHSRHGNIFSINDISADGDTKFPNLKLLTLSASDSRQIVV